MENEELKIREFVNSLFGKDYAPSQSAEFVAYFIRRICRGVVSSKKDIADSSYNSLFWNKAVRNQIRGEADDRVSLILEQDFRRLPETLRKILMYTICCFVSHVHDNYFVCSYLKGMMLDTYEKLVSQGNNELHFRVKGVLWDIIEDAYTGMINFGHVDLPETPKIAPEN